jgi:hypothetical protein
MRDLAEIERETFIVARELGHLRLEMADELYRAARALRERAAEAFLDAQAAAQRWAAIVEELDPFEEITPKILAALEERCEE